LTFIYFSPALCFIFVYNCGLTVRLINEYVMLGYVTVQQLGRSLTQTGVAKTPNSRRKSLYSYEYYTQVCCCLISKLIEFERLHRGSTTNVVLYCEASAAAVRESCSLRRSSPGRQGPDFQNILRQSYDYLSIMPKLRSTYDGRLIYKTSNERRKAFLKYDSLAKL